MTEVDARADSRERLITAAANLLVQAGGESVSTRAVCAAAGVGAPTLYHHFGDKQGLFDAVVAKGFETYLRRKRGRVDTADPVADLRTGWDMHVEFGQTNPSVYTLMYGSGRRPAAAQEAYRMLTAMVERVALAGRLTVPMRDAADMIDAAGIGVTLTLIGSATPSPALSARTRDAVLAAVTTDPPALPMGAQAVATLAMALDAAVDESTAPLTEAELALFREWLNRLAAGPA